MTKWILIALVAMPSFVSAEIYGPIYRDPDWRQSVLLSVVADSDCPFSKKQVEQEVEEEFSKEQITRTQILSGRWLNVHADCVSLETVAGLEHVMSLKVYWGRFGAYGFVDHGGVFVSGEDEVDSHLLGQIGTAVEDAVRTQIEFNLPSR